MTGCPRPLSTTTGIGMELPPSPVPSSLQGSPRLCLTSSFKIYHGIRHVSRNVRGTQILFTFKLNENVRLTAKFKDREQNFIPISRGPYVHLSADSWDAVLLYGNRFTDYSLRARTRNGCEVLSLQFRRCQTVVSGPRTLKASFFNQPLSCSARLESSMPVQTKDGWVLELEGRDTKRSIKNCKLESNGRPWCYVRKIKTDVIEIEAKAVIHEMCAFSIAGASFLCHL
jgi:hypothetical protein